MNTEAIEMQTDKNRIDMNRVEEIAIKMCKEEVESSKR